jgi:chromosome segregation ATPase
MKKSVLIAAVAVLAVTFISARTSAQAPPANDVNAALIRELHDLRIAIEKLASSSSRVQLLAARASQQEQTISNLTTQLIALNSKLAESNADMMISSATLDQLKDRLRSEADPKQRALLESQQTDLTVDFNRKRMMQSSVQAEADALRQQMSAAQAGLADLQRKLDELDRSLADTQK